VKRIIVCGSRGYHDRNKIASVLFDLAIEFDNPIIVHGYARGADRIANQEAQKLGLLIESHPAEWDAFGKGAGFIRNQKMADLGASVCVAFWDGRSSGTADMMDRARKKGIEVRVVE
jgi:hypothetical protein